MTPMQSTKRFVWLVLCIQCCNRVVHSALVSQQQGAYRSRSLFKPGYYPSHSNLLSDGHSCKEKRQRSSRRLEFFNFHAYTATGGAMEESGSSKRRSRTRTRSLRFVNDFSAGFQHIHSNYLEIFWTYSFSKAMKYLLPLCFLLVSCHYLSPDLGFFLSQSLDQTIETTFWITSWVGRILLLPLDAFGAAIKALPAIIVPMLDYMPPSVVVSLVSPVLFIYNMIHSLQSWFLLSTLAISVWRPILEEIQYRLFVTKIVGEERLGRSFGMAKSSMVEPMVLTLETINTTDTTDSNSTSMDSLSRSSLLSSFLFASTRLGWLCTSPDNVTPSPYAWTVGFSQSIFRLFSINGMSEIRPILQAGLTFLAMHQAVTTFLLSINIYAPFYKERGIFASIGAHIAWTTGIITIPFRLMRRLYIRVRFKKTTA
eukprot:scaffold1390_cov138-Cylindrotheca_fusiformis.AAC.42